MSHGLIFSQKCRLTSRPAGHNIWLVEFDGLAGEPATNSSFRPRAGLVGLPPSHRTDDGASSHDRAKFGPSTADFQPPGAQGSCPGWKLNSFEFGRPAAAGKTPFGRRKIRGKSYL